MSADFTPTDEFTDQTSVLLAQMPDSRLRPCERSTFCGPVGIMSKVYCVVCGDDGGAVTDDWAESIKYLCDACAEKWGKLPLPEIPEELVKGA